jgi:hypothetical protein
MASFFGCVALVPMRCMGTRPQKDLACGGHPQQGTAVYTAPPQKKYTLYSFVLDGFPFYDVTARNVSD